MRCTRKSNSKVLKQISTPKRKNYLSLDKNIQKAPKVSLIEGEVVNFKKLSMFEPTRKQFSSKKKLEKYNFDEYDNLFEKDLNSKNDDAKPVKILTSSAVKKVSFTTNVESNVQALHINTLDSNDSSLDSDNELESFIVNNRITLICHFIDNNGTTMYEDFMKKEYTMSKELFQKPLIIKLNPSGQRDLGSLLISNVYNAIKMNFNTAKNLIRIPSFEEFGENLLNKDELISFYRGFFKDFNFEISTIITTFIYIEKILNNPYNSFILTPNNIRLFILGCLTVSYKFNQSEDITAYKIYKYRESESKLYSEIAYFANISLRKLNQITNDVLICLLKFDLLIEINNYKSFLSAVLLKTIEIIPSFADLKNSILKKFP